MVSAVVAKIISMQQSLTVSENEIAQYVINNAETVVSSTITAIAKTTNTSEASINRFCKRLVSKGFNSFKIALAQENFYNSMKDQSDSGAQEGFVATVSRDYRHMLVNTTAMLDEDSVVQAAAAIRQARHVYFRPGSYGVRRPGAGVQAEYGGPVCQGPYRHQRHPGLRGQRGRRIW